MQTEQKLAPESSYPHRNRFMNLLSFVRTVKSMTHSRWRDNAAPVRRSDATWKLCVLIMAVSALERLSELCRFESHVGRFRI